MTEADRLALTLLVRSAPNTVVRGSRVPVLLELRNDSSRPVAGTIGDLRVLVTDVAGRALNEAGWVMAAAEAFALPAGQSIQMSVMVEMRGPRNGAARAPFHPGQYRLRGMGRVGLEGSVTTPSVVLESADQALEVLAPESEAL